MSTEKGGLMEKVVSLAKRRGFVFPGSEIYGGLANSWDYGPLGVELKNNIRDWWWSRFVRSRSGMVGIDAAVLMNPKVWDTSGHLKKFSDPLVECRACHQRFRPDQIGGVPEKGEEWTLPPCPSCGMSEWTNAAQFNLMFKTLIGTTEESASETYLRPEIAQAMFVNFKNVLDTTRVKVPFGIASVGKVFRNEITPGNFTYRTLEFDLMEFEYFIKEEEWEKSFEYWLSEQKRWLEDMGFDMSHTRVREHEKDELSHYSKRTADIEYETPFGWKEMFGLAYRTDFDLKNHMEKSGVDLRYTDPETGEKFIPHVIEPTFGLTRLLLMTLLESYREEDSRIWLSLHPRLAPYKAAIFPLLANKPELVGKARTIYEALLASDLSVSWDDRGNIGKRYFSQDEIGTPYCITVDFDTLENDTVTVRDRDTAKQERIAVSALEGHLEEKIQMK